MEQTESLGEKMERSMFDFHERQKRSLRSAFYACRQDGQCDMSANLDAIWEDSFREECQKQGGVVYYGSLVYDGVQFTSKSGKTVDKASMAPFPMVCAGDQCQPSYFETDCEPSIANFGRFGTDYF